MPQPNMHVTRLWSRARLLTIMVISLSATLGYSRTVTFAGREWVVKSGRGGPGPNHWSDSPASVWVDSEGLHLKIRKVDGVWRCAEVYTVKPTQHGMHRFYIASRVDKIDKNVVAAPFLYANDSQELDIEFSTWGKEGERARNAQFIAQPSSTAGNAKFFIASLNGDYSTHYINWQSSFVRFKSFHGHYAEPPNSNFLIKEWKYAGKDNPPESANLRIHINLWLMRGKPPSDGKEVEIVIKKADLPLTKSKKKRENGEKKKPPARGREDQERAAD